MTYGEIIYLICLSFLTGYAINMGISYMIQVYKDAHCGIFVQDDRAHSQKHFAIVGWAILILLLSYGNSFDSIQGTESIEHIVINLFAILMVFPHLADE